MAEAFLQELLRASNSVQSSIEDRNCVICFQETGTMSQETGLMEVQISLPCHHIVGSGCIAIWLKSNNSCPMCRREFFPADEDEDEDDEDEDYDQDLRYRMEYLRPFCQSYCLKLRLPGHIDRVAQQIIENLLRLYPFSQAITSIDYDSAVEIVTLGVYIASYVGSNFRSPREISRILVDSRGGYIGESTSANGDRIRALYRMMYLRMFSIIDDDVENLVGERPFPWPSLELYNISDDQIECDRDVAATNKYCEEYCDRLQLTVPLRSLSQHIAANLIHTGFHVLDCPENSRHSRHVSLTEIAAVSIYIASHLEGRPVSRTAIQSLIGDDLADIRSTYRIVRYECDNLVDEAFCRTLSIPLSWETLEADSAEERHEGVVSQIQRLCDSYCIRLAVNHISQTQSLAHKFVERFVSLEEYSPDSLAAACVYMACTCVGRPVSYRALVAATGLDICSIYDVHMRMCDEIVDGTISIDDIVQSSSARVSVQEVSLYMSVPQLPAGETG